MDPGLRYLIGLVFYGLKQVKVWWHLPLVLTMTYTFYVRERLLNNALFDAYPNPLPQAKRRCNDPVLGDGYIGCFSASLISDYKFQMQHLTPSVTPDNCIAQCKTAMFSYAALGQGQGATVAWDMRQRNMLMNAIAEKSAKETKRTDVGGRITSPFITPIFARTE